MRTVISFKFGRTNTQNTFAGNASINENIQKNIQELR